VKMRSDRLGINASSLYLATETCFETIREHILKLRPQAVVIDSIQTTYSQKVPSTPGSLTQVREVTAQFLMLSKTENFTTFLVGHVTKDGSLAGPKTMEHMVDTVLYLEGDRYHSFRILRSVKNRFGSTNEIGVFEMRPEGLKEVENPSELFLSERRPDCPGSTVVPTMEGSRPILAELQALVSPSGYGMARRASTGVDLNRISLLIAVIEKRLEIPLSGQDILVNAAGGIRVEEPALDMAMIAAILSSFKNTAVPPDLVICGEVGLGGEARAIGQIENRIGEACKLGFKRCILPENSRRKLPNNSSSIELLGISQIQDMNRLLFS
jgi:DNA repair protein RadA/Sms